MIGMGTPRKSRRIERIADLPPSYQCGHVAELTPVAELVFRAVLGGRRLP
jgi:hypothetical protein